MGFRQGAYAKIWDIQQGNGNYFVARMTISKKQQDGTYLNEWQDNFVHLCAMAADQAQQIERGSTVRIGDCDVTNKYDKEKKVTYTNYAIFNFTAIEPPRNPVPMPDVMPTIPGTPQAESPKNADVPPTEEQKEELPQIEEEEDLPF